MSILKPETAICMSSVPKFIMTDINLFGLYCCEHKEHMSYSDE